MFSTEIVEEYYDKCQKYYNWFWSDKDSLAMHYGFWYSDTKNKKEALVNQYKDVSKCLEIKSSDLVLDAGCGIGGACIWMAEKYGCKVIGITLSSNQIKLARLYAAKRHVSSRAEFRKEDFLKTHFADNHFDKIFAIESFCYSYPNPKAFFSEANRILQPGGTVVISDAYLKRKPTSIAEKKMIDKFYLGWKLSGGCTSQEIVEAAASSGLRLVSSMEKTQNIIRNVWRIYFRGLLASPILRFLRIMRLISLTEYENSFACKLQRKMVHSGIMGYKIFVFKKN